MAVYGNAYGGLSHKMRFKHETERDETNQRFQIKEKDNKVIIIFQ